MKTTEDGIKDVTGVVTNPHIKAGRAGKKGRGTPLFSLLAVQQKWQAKKHSMCGEDLAQSHTDSEVAVKVSVSPYD